MLFKIKTPSLRPHYVERVRPCLNHVTLSTALHPRAAQHLGGIPGHLPNTEQEESQEQETREGQPWPAPELQPLSWTHELRRPQQECWVRWWGSVVGTTMEGPGEGDGEGGREGGRLLCSAVRKRVAWWGRA